jgi:hypothetical protein
MFKNLVFKLSLLTAALGSVSAAWAAEAGRVVFVTGEVQLANGAAVLNAAVQEGDELTTGAAGYVYVKTVDGGFLILRPNSKARITTYHVDQVTPANTRVKLELLSGVARTISGSAVKQARQNFRFNTPVAAIGVRGTDFIVFTDQQTSRVQVVSGGVVMSPFAGNCGPDGGGPCEGSGSRELFAGQPGALLQIQRGQRVPNLLHNPALAPDQTVAPRVDEPVGKVVPTAPLAPPLPVVEINLDPHKGDAAKQVNSNTTPPVVVPPVMPPPVITPPVVTPPEPPLVVDPAPVVPPVAAYKPEVAWGRFAAVAGLQPDEAAVAKLNDGTYSTKDTVIVGAYQLSRLKANTFVMPKEGVGTYALDGGEATLRNKDSGGAVLPAEIKDASLKIDYAARKFETSLSLVTAQGDKSGPMSAVGNLHSDGALFDVNPAKPNVVPMTVRGFVSGAKAQEASYLFKIDSLKWEANGATHWGVQK